MLQTELIALLRCPAAQPKLYKETHRSWGSGKSTRPTQCSGELFLGLLLAVAGSQRRSARVAVGSCSGRVTGSVDHEGEPLRPPSDGPDPSAEDAVSW